MIDGYALGFIQGMCAQRPEYPAEIGTAYRWFLVPSYVEVPGLTGKKLKKLDALELDVRRVSEVRGPDGQALLTPDVVKVHVTMDQPIRIRGIPHVSAVRLGIVPEQKLVLWQVF